MRGSSLEADLSAALGHHQRGELESARLKYLDILGRHPRCFEALHLLGLLSADSGAVDEGIALIRRALDVDAAKPHAHYSLATAFLKKGDGPAAVSCLDRALALQADFADAWFLRGNVLQQMERFEASVESYRAAIRIRPAFPEACNNLAAALRALRRLPDALECVERALALRPAYPLAFNNRGLIWLDGQRGDAAVEDFRRALALNPKFPEALHNLGTALSQLRRFGAARDAFAELAALAPGFRHVAGNLLVAKLCCCDWTGFEPAAAAVVRAVERGEHAAMPLSFLCISGAPGAQRRCAETHSSAYFPPAVPYPPGVPDPSAVPHPPTAPDPPAAPYPPARSPQRRDKIRIAYLSGDFGEHAVSYLLAGVFERHDSAHFDTLALSWGRREEGPARRRIEAAFSRFIDITARTDAEVARLMRELEVDIAVDLSGHTLGQRTGIFSRRPADIQVNYLGLPGTMGAPYIDYLIADRFLVPEELRHHYTEQVVWLPESFQPNDDRRAAAAQSCGRSGYGLPAEGVVFCCFNRNNKLNPPCFDAWMRLLEGVPRSVLWLLATDPLAESNLRREAAARGVDAGRLVFAREAPYAEYLARYACADLFLDTLPFNGGATVSDALSTGLPVLTCAGESFSGRMAGSVLTSLGFPELVARSMEEYVATALALAAQPERLIALRRSLESQRSAHRFFDTDRYRVHLEAAYRMMWERHAAGLPPQAFAVAAV
jgi:predicted O-linked N-acetylglucosamine transferase (SPINDLY family)